MPYRLVNVEDRNRDNPERFHISTRAQRESLFVGDAAKCIFEGTMGEGGERMWLTILDPISPGKYYGELLNQPVMIDGIKAGDRIEFGPENISDFGKAPRGGLYKPGLAQKGG